MAEWVPQSMTESLGRTPWVRRLALTLTLTVVAQAARAGAEPAPTLTATSAEVPFGDTPVAYDVPARRLVVAASGLADGHGHLDAQRLRAREAAVSRGTERLVAYVDDRLAAASVSPALAARVHDRVAEAVAVEDDRPLSDGSIVVRLSLPCAVLQQAWPAGQTWWAR